MAEDLLKVFTGRHTDTEVGEGYHINISPFTMNASLAVGGERETHCRSRSTVSYTQTPKLYDRVARRSLRISLPYYGVFCE